MASFSSCSVQKYTPDQRSKSCETVCSSNSSCYLQRRKPIHPLANGFRANFGRTGNNAVRQRVLSAKLLKLRTLQNQLNDANFHLAELSKENQALKTLQKRQDKALSRYEGTNADLPRLLQTHEEEIRVLTERNKTLRKTVRELNEQMRAREEELINVKEQLKHLEKLDKDKHLGEREKLSEQLEDMKIQIKKYEEQVNTLNRKIMLENKNFKFKLNSEMMKHKQCQRELAQALAEIDKLTGLLESREKISTVSIGDRKRFSSVPKRQSMSLISLKPTKSRSGDSSEKNSTDDLLATRDIKLEPIQHRKEDAQNANKKLDGILKPPSENIKARLSANLHKRLDIDKSRFSDSANSSGIDQHIVTDSDLSAESRRDSTQSTLSTLGNSRPTSSQKLDKLSQSIESTIQKAIENGSNEFDIRLGDYCTEVVNTVKNCSEVIENHEKSLKTAKADTKTILEALKQTEQMEKKLKQGHMLSIDGENMTDDSVSLVHQILKDELMFHERNKEAKSRNSVDANMNLSKGPKVPQEDKKKLLATLRAIDNGDSVESVDSTPQRKTKVMTELFGDIEI